MTTWKTSKTDWALLSLLAALWLPTMFAASYGWRYGVYYDYGWFVPVAAMCLLIRRWRTLGTAAKLPWRRLTLVALVLVFWCFGLRVLGNADPSWRLPMGLLAVTAVITSHGMLLLTHGWRSSATFGWITLLALSAVPWPSVVELWIIKSLTSGVILTVGEWFNISGRPVEIAGVNMRLYDTTVEVSDGCSGVRSFQSFVMATWFFAELQRMRASRVVILLLCAFGAAFVVNVIRTWALATIRFDYGIDAFERAHDWLGIIAFLVSGAFFYYISGWLAGSLQQREMRRVTKKTEDD